MNLSQFYQNNKKAVLIICPIVTVILIIAIVGIILNVTNTDNKKSTDQTVYLPSNTCPDNNNVFLENGKKQADLNGKPYRVKDADETWINQNCKKTGQTPSITQSPTVSASSTQVVEDAPPLLLKSIGFKFETYNPQTQMAGDMKFTKIKLPFDQIFSPFGQQDPRTTDTTKKNPQPVFILPLGTNVLSLVDGEVVDVKQLYSNDYTVMVAKNKTSNWIYETEHINNPKVKVGDKVTAGQVLGIVSDYDSKNNPGFGLVEIGILHPTSNGGVPEHFCPFKYMDPSIKDSTNAKITALYSAWESYKGTDIYKQETFKSPGCAIESAVQG